MMTRHISEDRIIDRLIRCGPAGARVLAAGLSLDEGALKRRLDGMEARGALVSSVPVVAGRGRPGRVYEASDDPYRGL